MNPEDAEEFTQGLGQIVAGARRQMEEGARLGVPQALGLSPGEWVETRLGATSEDSLPARPEQATEITAQDEKPTGGRHQRKTLSRRISQAIRRSPGTSREPGSRPNASRIKAHYSPRHWLVIPVCGVLGLFAGVMWAASAPPSYKSQAAAFVSMTALPTDDPNHSDPFGGSQFALQRVQSYAHLATSPQVLQAAINELHRGDAAEVAKHVDVSSSGGVILWVTVDDRDPQTAARMADAVMANLVRTVAALEADGGPRAPVQIVPVQPAIVPDKAEGSGAIIKTLAGLLLGLGLGGAAFHFIRIRRAGQSHPGTDNKPRPAQSRQTQPRQAQQAPPEEPDAEHHGTNGVVVLRVGDGRDFSRRVGR